jgi:hypothetical protein
LSTRPRTELAALIAAAALAAGCGDKVPESEASRRAGEQPKKIIDKASTDLSKALEKGARRQADEPK